MSERHLLSEADMQNDLDTTERDITRLKALVENLRVFIRDTDQEPAYYKMTLLHFEADLARGQALAARIRGMLAGVSAYISFLKETTP